MVDIKGHHIQICSFSNSPFKKVYDGYIVSPLLLLVDYPTSNKPSLQGGLDPNKSTNSGVTLRHLVRVR